MQVSDFFPKKAAPAPALGANKVEWPSISTATASFVPREFTPSSFSHVKEPVAGDFAKKEWAISDQETNFAAKSQFSDLKSSESTDSSSGDDTTSETSSIKRSNSSSSLKTELAPASSAAQSVNPFRLGATDFKPTTTFSASTTFTPSAPFQPTHLQSFVAPAQTQATVYTQGGFYANQDYYMQPMGSFEMGAPAYVQYDADGKYKTELCKNWIETAKCRYEGKCRFAHGQEELTSFAVNMYDEKFKSKNCRTFYHTKQCMYGSRCMFRHEHRNYRQLHRHYYTPHLYVLETLFDTAKNESKFLGAFKPATGRLPIFKAIQAVHEADVGYESSDSESELP